ncbi:MAG TPA: DUF4349 domain-containing protein [Solirubrobacteraceae bacterium]|jgi:hypothetical protein|nr:DUF4349 domain-containing protein [Solirubrobacteraceae bacterium]
MKIVHFPKPSDADGPEDFAAQLDAALYGDAGGSQAESWRELCDDVRTLATPMSPQFEAALRERIEQRAAAAPRRARLVRPRAKLARVRAWLASGVAPRLFALGGACAVAVVLVVTIAAPWQASVSSSSSSALRARADELGAAQGQVKAQSQTFESSGTNAASGAAAVPATKVGKTSATIPETATALTPDAGGASARIQQRAATLTLAPKPDAVQSVADQVAQLATRDGGFVQNSQVRLQRGSGGEANVQLSLPSARLSAALAELARLAPTRAQSQSLQDITDVYGAARAKLADAVAERQALLRALARASTQGDIESLRARLSLVGGNIVRDRTALAAVSKRGSSSSVEVTVVGDAHAGSDRSTLSKGLHDAGDVLKVALAVFLVALAVLVPLAILAALVALGWRASRRRLRERALS